MQAQLAVYREVHHLVDALQLHVVKVQDQCILAAGWMPHEAYR